MNTTGGVHGAAFCWDYYGTHAECENKMAERLKMINWRDCILSGGVVVCPSSCGRALSLSLSFSSLHLFISCLRLPRLSSLAFFAGPSAAVARCSCALAPGFISRVSHFRACCNSVGSLLHCEGSREFKRHRLSPFTNLYTYSRTPPSLCVLFSSYQLTHIPLPRPRTPPRSLVAPV